MASLEKKKLKQTKEVGTIFNLFNRKENANKEMKKVGVVYTPSEGTEDGLPKINDVTEYYYIKDNSLHYYSKIALSGHLLVNLANLTEAEILEKLLHHVNIKDTDAKLAFCKDAAKSIMALQSKTSTASMNLF